MRTFENENYYEVLQISINADRDEIKKAYRAARAVYQEGSVVTYALFTHQQRQKLLSAIEAAFETLDDPDRRAVYNQQLIDSGTVSADRFDRRLQRELAACSETDNASKQASFDRWVARRSEKAEIQQRIAAIMSKTCVSGDALKQLREAYGIELSEIHAITRISKDVLAKIEADRFDELPAAFYLKQFLKTYAEMLRIDARHVVDGFFNEMAMITAESQSTDASSER